MFRSHKLTIKLRISFFQCNEKKQNSGMLWQTEFLNNNAFCSCYYDYTSLCFKSNF